MPFGSIIMWVLAARAAQFGSPGRKVSEVHFLAPVDLTNNNKEAAMRLVTAACVLLLQPALSNSQRLECCIARFHVDSGEKGCSRHAVLPRGFRSEVIYRSSPLGSF
jgi:hypothetical protein